MFLPQKDITDQILGKLAGIYPGVLKDDEALILSPDLERKEKIKYLTYCLEKLYIEAIAGTRNPDHSPQEYINIKIKAAGLDYLSGRHS